MKYQTIYDNHTNGNLSDYKKQINGLTKIEILEYAVFVSDITLLSAFQIIDHLLATLKKN